MSELGEKADRILELLSKEKTLTVEELKKKIALEDASLLYFMHHGELIELKKGKARITDFGAGIISAE
ncbi:MAG: hypothetical protein Q8N79_01145 [Candidatus Methanoperedens sp.]|nr:hypothetical protein [Candidatus Methanoperedens sp.]